ncbi:MAG: cytochrome P450 [Novosphingobium sp.]|nr:cytochrome P450 [Novosphingobium sp.]
MNIETGKLHRAIPDHVPPALVVDYDLYKGDLIADSGDLHEGLHLLGERFGRGVFWSPHSGGHWFINDYEMVFEAARGPDLFSSTAMTLPPVPQEPRLIPLFTDPPEHGIFRAPLMKLFTPGRMRALEPGIRAFAAELIEEVAPKGRCDFVEAISEMMPVVVFMKLMGMPLERRQEFRRWTFDILSDDDDRRMRAYANVAELMDGLIAERSTQPKDDIISQLMALELQGRPITYEEIQAYCLLLFIAGLDTVANSLSFSMNHMAAHGELQDRLRAHPEQVPEAVEEFFRRFGVPMPVRTATQDFDFHGAPIRKGERVLLMVPAANLDPRRFANPMVFDIDREDKTHIGFHAGPHRCVGSHLARIEMEVFWEEWLRRMPNVRHDPERAVITRAGLTLAIQQLPLVWDV